ncbi:unnamed protein product, partial [Symbiodinium natans]
MLVCPTLADTKAVGPAPFDTCRQLPGGKRRRKAIATVDRLQRWSEGERASLHVAGFDRKACNALLATGLCPDHLNTAAALRILRPTQPTPDVAFDDLLKVLRIWLARPTIAVGEIMMVRDEARAGLDLTIFYLDDGVIAAD